MNKTSIFAIGFGIGILGVLALYFFYFVPEVDKAYQRGLSEFKANTDTLYLKGKGKVIVDTVYIKKNFSSDIQIKDDTISAGFDSSFVSKGDTVDAKIKVVIDKTAKWFVDLGIRKAETIRVDTVKIYQPKFIEKVEKVNNWLWIFVSFLGGILSAIGLFLIN